MLLQMKQVKKWYGDRLILSADELSVYLGDKIGVVGANGSGKTTLLHLIAGVLEPEEGRIVRLGEISYCRQFDKNWGQTDGLWSPDEKNQAARSGGELMKERLSKALSDSRHILLLDEPTANLDLAGVAQLKRQLRQVETMLCISHDRDLLNEVCTGILEIEGGAISYYPMKYAEYQRQKERQREEKQREYEAYTEEKKRLEQVYQEKSRMAERMVKIPKGMTPREARLRDFLTVSGRNSSGKQKNLHRTAENVRKRIEHMEKKEKPKEIPAMRLSFERTDPPENRRVIEVRELAFSYGETPIFANASFTITNHKKTAILGANGTGKTTLLHLIMEEERRKREEEGIESQGAEGIRQQSGTICIVPRARLGCLEQNLSQLNLKETVLENVKRDSVQTETAIRTILAGLLFAAGDLEKQAEVLSGGERMKLAMARLFVSKANVLLLDEPTNYLDIPSIQALQKQIKEYEGTIVIVSHDRRFVEETADELLLLEEKAVRKFPGTLKQYEAAEKDKKDKKEKGGAGLGEEERLRLELRQAHLTGLLGHVGSLEEKERLEAEYWQITRLLQEGRPGRR